MEIQWGGQGPPPKIVNIIAGRSVPKRMKLCIDIVDVASNLAQQQ